MGFLFQSVQPFMQARLANYIAGILPESNKLERIWILAKTDYVQRYYGSNLGIFWAFINPLLRVMVYYFVFTMIFQNRIPNYALYLFSGLLLWRFFSEATNSGIDLLKKKRYLIQNIGMRKFDLYISSVLSSLIGFLINFFIYFLISILFRVEYTSTVLYFPVLVFNTCLIIISVSMLLSAIAVQFKDIKHIWDIALLLGLWVSPIFYGKTLVFQRVPELLYANPLAGIIINLRETVLYARQPDMFLLWYDLAYAVVLMLITLPIYNKLSKKGPEKL